MQETEWQIGDLSLETPQKDQMSPRETGQQRVKVVEELKAE